MVSVVAPWTCSGCRVEEVERELRTKVEGVVSLETRELTGERVWTRSV